MIIHIDSRLWSSMFELQEFLSYFYGNLDKCVPGPLLWRVRLDVVQAKLSISIKSTTPCHTMPHFECFSIKIKFPCQWSLELNCLVIHFRMSKYYLSIHDRHLYCLYFCNRHRGGQDFEFWNKSNLYFS